MLKERVGDGCFIRADVTEAEDVATLVQRTVATHGRLNVAFNNVSFEGQQAAMDRRYMWDAVSRLGGAPCTRTPVVCRNREASGRGEGGST